MTTKQNKIIFSLFLLVLVLFFSLSVFLVNEYDNKILPNVYVGEYNFGGLNQQEAIQKFQQFNDQLAADGIEVHYENNDGNLEDFNLNTLLVLGEQGGNTIELIQSDPQKEAKRLVEYGKNKGYFGILKNFIIQLNSKKRFQLKTVKLNEDRIKNILSENIGGEEKEPKNASLKITTIKPLEYEIEGSSPGYVYDYAGSIKDIESQWRKLKIPSIRVEKKSKKPQINKSDLQPLLDQLDRVFTEQIEITYKKEEKDRVWGITLEQIKNWVKPKREGDKVVLGVDKEKMSEFIENNIAKQVNKPAQNAKFEIKQKVVEKFEPASSGVNVDLEKNLTRLEQVLQDRMNTTTPKNVSSSLKLAVKTTEPEVSISDANNLGIEEKLATGVSDFSGSPANRIHNIKVGSRKLDGLLIPPGEEFSAVKSTRPYTRAAGYLPELVIKGKKLKPELGGGLCQLGTTLFRMAMESGMPITERRNHSLVVSYYTDPVNGLPGTDATLYNPKPDFRFKNNTDDYLLIETEVDVQRGKLYYTLWGDDDGRSKSDYTHPSVSEWFEPGPTQYNKTTSLPPGEMNCQKAHRGANASFTYNRVLSNGETKKRVFSSHYRPLPRICLVGVKEKCLNNPECKVGPNGVSYPDSKNTTSSKKISN
ncbi:MAG: VanW family protein [Candidatus Magasanikbacteria bacterium]